MSSIVISSCYLCRSCLHDEGRVENLALRLHARYLELLEQGHSLALPLTAQVVAREHCQSCHEELPLLVLVETAPLSD